ncbi:MAG: hypothetical protein H6741_15325 [Alphaproteobacteria bacterium]|nr:hypothetical protein [Alphaproteobacteria bacterium]
MTPTLLIAAALANPLPDPVEVERAAAVHVTPQGFDAIAQALAGLAPESITEESIETEFECQSGDPAPLSLVINDLTLHVEVLDSSLVPSRDALELELSLALWAESPDVSASGYCFTSNPISQQCTIEIPESDPITIDAALHIDMLLREDGEWVVNVDDPTVTIGPIANPIGDGANCELDNLLSSLLTLDPDFLRNLVLSLLDDQLVGLGEDVEAPIEDALSSLNIETSFALGDADIDLAVYPSEFRLRDTGLLLGLGGTVAPSQLAPCVGDSTGPELSGEAWPDFGSSSWDGAISQDMSLVLGKDFTDALLWSVWGTGTFCLEVSDLAGATLGTDLLGNLLGDSFAELFPEDKAAALVINAAAPPTASFDAVMPLYIDLHDLQLDAVAELDDRMDRVAQVTAEGAIGVNLNLEGTTFAPGLEVDPEALTFSETYTELLAPGYAEGIAGFLPTVLSSFLPEDLLPTLDIPSVQGIGVESVTWMPDESGYWLGGFVMVDTENVEPLQVTGCAGALGCGGDGGGGGCEDALGCGDTGCEDGSCDSGCAHGGPIRLPGGRIAVLLTMLIGAALRRRE